MEKFLYEAKNLGCETHIFNNKEELRRFIINFVWGKGEHKILLKNNDFLSSLKLDKYLKTVSSFDDKIIIGVTEVNYGISFTGSLVEFFENDIEKLPSLLPEIHIAILKKKNILNDYYELLSKIKDNRDFIFITGPSKTADIEKIVVNGAHGPKELIILIYTDN